MMSWGVRIQTRICLVREAVSTVITAAKPMESQTQLAAYLRSSA